MYTGNDWWAYLEHGWGKKPEQKAKEKAYNAKYYKEHPEKWGKKEAPINKPEAKNPWKLDDKAFDLLSEKYGINYGRLKLADPKILLIAISEATNQRHSLNVFDKAAKELAISMAKDAGGFKFSNFFSNKKKENLYPDPEPPKHPNLTNHHKAFVSGKAKGAVYRRGNALDEGPVGRR